MDKYYRLVQEYKGERKVFVPENSYEPFDEFGIFDKNKVNVFKEVCFSASIPRCIFGLGTWLQKGEYYVYETDEPPCIDLRRDENPSVFQVAGEVRYRRNIRAALIGKLTISKRNRSRYRKMGERISNGWCDIEEILEEVELIGMDIMKDFITYGQGVYCAD